MAVRLLKRFWTHMLIVFNENYTSEGFEKTKKKFELPEDLSTLDPQSKRKLTICNLFVNQNLSIKDICVVLDASQHQVIDTLIDNDLIKERRRKNRTRKQDSLSITPEDPRDNVGPADRSDFSADSGSEKRGEESDSRRDESEYSAVNGVDNTAKTPTDSDRRTQFLPF